MRYLNDARDARLAALSEQLLAVYARDGDWQALSANARAWHRLLRDAMRPASPVTMDRRHLTLR